MAKKKRQSAQRSSHVRAKRKPAPKRPLYKESPRTRRAARPADWYTSLRTPQERREVVRYLKEALVGRAGHEGNVGEDRREPGLRDVFTGFGASEGYDLRHVERWSKRRHDRVQAMAKQLHELTARPFSVVTPRNKRQRAALRHFTAQVEPKQKAYIVHVPAKIYRVRMSTIRHGKRKQAHLHIETPQRFGGYGKLRYLLFRDYLGRQPATEQDFVRATEMMLPDIPEWAFLSIVSRTSGIISGPQPRNSIVRRMQIYFAEGESFAGRVNDASDVLMGWVIQGDEETAERVAAARNNRKASLPENRRAQAARNRRRKFLKLPPLPK